MDNGTFCFRSATPFGMDLDTGEAIYSYEEKLTLGDNGELGVYGELRSSQFPKYSIGIGPSMNDNPEVSIGTIALRATDSSYTDGDIFQIADASIDDNKIIELRLNSRDTKFACEENLAYITNGTAYISTYNGDVQLSTYSHPYVWINYYEPMYGLRPTAYKFGNGTEGGLADIRCGKIIVGGDTVWNNTTANITGNAYVAGDCYANNYYNNSTRDIKKNIQPQKADALSLIKLLKFYSYDYDMDLNQTTDNSEPKQSHIEFGLVAEESPQEIKSEDGKAINLYEFISLTAKSVQELTAKVEQQAQEITKLKAELSALKQ